MPDYGKNLGKYLYPKLGDIGKSMAKKAVAPPELYISKDRDVGILRGERSKTRDKNISSPDQSNRRINVTKRSV